MKTRLGISAMLMLVGTSLAPRHVSSQAELLRPLVGTWQSDTTGGVSARSTCRWSPGGSAVFCEQQIAGLPGTTSALNLFIPDSTPGQFALYVLSRTGQTISPVPLAIVGTAWYYGGKAIGADGQYRRTVNDFSRADIYSWRQESSTDAVHWNTGVHGLSRRIE